MNFYHILCNYKDLNFYEKTLLSEQRCYSIISLTTKHQLMKRLVILLFLMSAVTLASLAQGWLKLTAYPSNVFPQMQDYILINKVLDPYVEYINRKYAFQQDIPAIFCDWWVKNAFYYPSEKKIVVYFSFGYLWKKVSFMVYWPYNILYHDRIRVSILSFIEIWIHQVFKWFCHFLWTRKGLWWYLDHSRQGCISGKCFGQGRAKA